MSNAKEFAIIDYLQQVTGGLINCNQHTAKRIIELATHGPTATIVKSRYCWVENSYKKVRTIHTSDNIVKDVFAQCKGNVDQKFYKYDCIVNDKTVLATIYSLNPHLFD